MTSACLISLPDASLAVGAARTGDKEVQLDGELERLLTWLSCRVNPILLYMMFSSNIAHGIDGHAPDPDRLNRIRASALGDPEDGFEATDIDSDSSERPKRAKRYSKTPRSEIVAKPRNSDSIPANGAMYWKLRSSIFGGGLPAKMLSPYAAPISQERRVSVSVRRSQNTKKKDKKLRQAC